MAKFLVTYHGPGHPDAAGMESARKDFMAWLGNAGSAVADPGAPVAYTDQISAGAPSPAAEIVGYSVMKADSIEAMQELLASHPSWPGTELCRSTMPWPAHSPHVSRVLARYRGTSVPMGSLRQSQQRW